MLFSMEPFGCLPDGCAATLYVMENAAGMTLAVTDYGARVVRLLVPDRAGKFADVALGYDSVRGYLTPGSFYFGATCGPVANRISGAAFSLHGQRYVLDANEKSMTTLHGGSSGFSSRLWNAEFIGTGLRFTYRRPDGEGGFPGMLDVSVTYSLTEHGTVRMEYEAVSNCDTPVNLTNHTYFNLAGHDSGSVTDQMLWLDAPAFTPVDRDKIPTGETRRVDGTPFDFRVGKALGSAIEANDPAIRAACGVDHNFVLAGGSFETPRTIGRLCDPASGRAMEIRTTEPCLQVYTGNCMSDCAGKGGAAYREHGAICLEAQRYPNAMNTPAFPYVTLHKNDMYKQITEYAFVTM